jgi:cyclopropane fatty-acyl-phospholipid synthase-like methyltransferase
VCPENINEKLSIQEREYAIPYHYQDLFAPGQSIGRNSIFETLLRLLNTNGHSKILDIGCGDGRFCYFAKAYCTVEGIDISERALAWAKVFNPEVTFYHGRLQQQDYMEPFDGAVCIETMEHIPNGEVPTFLAKASTILKSNSKLIFTVPSINQPLASKHFRHCEESTLHSALSPYFEVEIIGHSRISKWHRRVMSMLNLISLLVYSEQFRNTYTRFVKYIADKKIKYWYKHLHEGPSEQCYRLIAVCTVKKKIWSSEVFANSRG